MLRLVRAGGCVRGKGVKSRGWEERGGTSRLGIVTSLEKACAGR